MGGQKKVTAGHLERQRTAWKVESGKWKESVQGKSMTSLESFQCLEWLGMPS